MKRVVIVGIGGHAKVVANCIQEQGTYQISGFYITETSRSFPDQYLGLPVLTKLDQFSNEEIYFVVAIGDNYTRCKLAKDLAQQYPFLKLALVIHPSAVIAKDSSIADGTVIAPRAVVNSGAVIDEGVLVNTGAIVEHDCHLDKYSSCAPQSVIGGKCEVGKLSAISIGSTVIHGIKIGDNTIIGAGAVVTQNISSDSVAYGTPCKVIRSRKVDEPYY